MTLEMEMTRTTQEVFDSHREAIETIDFEKLAADYAEDCVFVTPDGAFHGRQAIMDGFFMPIAAQFPDIKINFDKVVIEDDVCLLQWSADSSAMRMPVGVGVFHIKDGLIQRQAEWFQMELK